MMLRIWKARRRLELWNGDKLALAAAIQLGFGADLGPKRMEGDGKTPEGRYTVCSKNPKSRFYLSLGISYPGPDDAEAAFADGRIDAGQRRAILSSERALWDTPLGGWIMVHGQPADGARSGDWTAGCIAVSNADMERIYASVSLGDAVEIFP